MNLVFKYLNIDFLMYQYFKELLNSTLLF